MKEMKFILGKMNKSFNHYSKNLLHLLINVYAGLILFQI